MGGASESRRVHWKIPNSRGKHFPCINPINGPCQSAVSHRVRRNFFNCAITKKQISSNFLEVQIRNNRELATNEDFNLAYLWRKYERESGVKFDIQKDATNKIFQQPKDDALKNCDMEHVTHNLVSTVSQK